MGDLIKAIEYLGIPATVGVAAITGYLILNFIGEILELMGKVVPEFMKVRKFFKRKHDEKAQQQKLMKDMQDALNKFNKHYDSDNIALRNNWMNWVNSRAEVYDEALDDLRAMKESLVSNNELTLDLYININRNRIIDFASKVANENSMVSREEYQRIFRIHDEYEDTLKRHNKTNGEVDVAYRIIIESYEDHMKNHTFIEDIRGYNN